MSLIKEAIKLVAIGKKGSRSLKGEQVEHLLAELKAGPSDPVQRAALATALYFKGIHEHEKPLLEYLLSSEEVHPEIFIKKLIPDTQVSFQKLVMKLLEGGRLHQREAQDLGDFYFNIDQFQTEQDDMARAISCVWLRLRYASHDEYKGLYQAFMKTIKPDFNHKQTIDQNLVQLSEPFDGVDKSPLVTPLIASHLISEGFRVVSLTGDSSGPKYGVTLKSLAENLGCPFLSSNEDLKPCSSRFGAYIDQKKVTDAWSYWKELRKRLIKRPFMATLEKFTHVMGAGISVTSAFHEGFLEKMLHLGEGAGYPMNIVVRKGREGSLTFSLSKPVVIHCSVKQESGDYLRHSFEHSMSDLNRDFLPDGRELMTLDKNTDLIQNYFNGRFTSGKAAKTQPKDKENKKGKIDHKADEYEKFFWRVHLTISGLKRALDWMKKNQP